MHKKIFRINSRKTLFISCLFHIYLQGLGIKNDYLKDKDYFAKDNNNVTIAFLCVVFLFIMKGLVLKQIICELKNILKLMQMR